MANITPQTYHLRSILSNRRLVFALLQSAVGNVGVMRTRIFSTSLCRLCLLSRSDIAVILDTYNPLDDKHRTDISFG